MNQILVVDDDSVLQKSIEQTLLYHNFSVKCANDGAEALRYVLSSDQKFDLVLLDVNMPQMNGMEALIEMKKHDPRLIVIMLTAYSNIQDAVKAVKEGAYNYLEKPIAADNLVALIKRALKARSLVETTAFSAPFLSMGEQSEHPFVGESLSMKKVFGLIQKLARVSTPVLIRGESGTGKELVARAIHYNGPRKEEKLVTINCAAIPENLIESELFGFEKGAFTGASERKIGKFQYADGGTLFLDEIGDISSALQVKLLRVIQEKKFTPIGSNREITVDVRIIAASHRSFENMIRENKFREDLFYRLNVLPVYLPPLRERRTDIPSLLTYYIDYFNNLYQLNIQNISTEAQEVLVNYDWPGNIRELRNVIEHAFIIEPSNTIHVESLPENVLATPLHAKATVPHLQDKSVLDFNEIRNSALEGYHTDKDKNSGIQIKFARELEDHLDFQFAKEIFEKEFIMEALKSNNGRINQTALKANIPKKTLLRKIERYAINPKDFYTL